MADKELDALLKVSAALEGLDEEAIKRVMQWVSSKHKIEMKEQIASGGKKPPTGDSVPEFESFPDFYDACSPKTENEKVLITGYWCQFHENKVEWDSQSVNSMLKNLGHAVSNITRTLDRLQEAKPRLAIQTQKSGSSKQARKLYKVTVEGTKIVKKMLAGEHSSEDE